MQVSRSEMVTALEAVKGAVADKGFVPILTHVYVSGDSVLGYDSEIGIRHKLSTKLDASFNVKADTFLNLLKNLEDDELDITVDEKAIHLKCGSHKSKLAQITEEFPKPNVAIKKSDWVDLPAGFKEALERALSAASEDENNRSLCAVMVKGEHIYGADGQRVVRCAVEGMTVKPFLLGRKAVKELVRLGSPKRVAITDSIAVFDFLNLVFLARLNDAAGYPAEMYDKLLATRTTNHAVPTGMKEALTRLALFTDKENPTVKMNPTPLGLELSAQGGLASATELLAPWPEEFPVKGLNPAYMLDALTYAETLHMGASLQEPFYMTAESSGFECLVAPRKAD